MLLVCCPDLQALETWLRAEPIRKELRQFFSELAADYQRMEVPLGEVAFMRLARKAHAPALAACLKALGKDALAATLKGSTLPSKPRGGRFRR